MQSAFVAHGFVQKGRLPSTLAHSAYSQLRNDTLWTRSCLPASCLTRSLTNSVLESQGLPRFGSQPSPPRQRMEGRTAEARPLSHPSGTGNRGTRVERLG